MTRPRDQRPSGGRIGLRRERLGGYQVMMGRARMQYLCQRILLLWREIYVSEEKGVVLEGDRIREHSMVARSGRCRLPCREAVEFQQSRKMSDFRGRDQ